jgi:hypothetical protein
MPSQHPGDDGRSAWNRGPEIIAAEQRILTYADALLSWCRASTFDTQYMVKLADFFTHTRKYNPGGEPVPMGETTAWMLERLDPDANRFLVELMRAAWELRCWKERYGEITKEEKDRL